MKFVNKYWKKLLLIFLVAFIATFLNNFIHFYVISQTASNCSSVKFLQCNILYALKDTLFVMFTAPFSSLFISRANPDQYFATSMAFVAWLVSMFFFIVFFIIVLLFVF